MSHKRRHRPRQNKASRKAAIARGKRVGKAVQKARDQRAVKATVLGAALQGLVFAKKAWSRGLRWASTARNASGATLRGVALACAEKKNILCEIRSPRPGRPVAQATGTAQEAKSRLIGVARSRP